MPRAKPLPAQDLGGITTPATSPDGPKFCPRCFRVEYEIGPQNCGNFALSCPPPAQLPKDAVVTIACGPCAFTRTVPIANLVQGRRVDELRNCLHDECQCRRID